MPCSFIRDRAVRPGKEFVTSHSFTDEMPTRCMRGVDVTTRFAVSLQQLWSLPISLPDVGIRSDNWRRPVRLPNLVLCGADVTTDKAIAALMPTLFKPVYLWWSGMPLSLPPKRRGTLILLGLAGLDGDQQKKLLLWLHNTDGRVHVVSTTSVPLLSLVESGLLLEILYDQLKGIQVGVQTSNEYSRSTTSREGVCFTSGLAIPGARRR